MNTATTSLHPYDALTPEVMLDAVETQGHRCTGAFLALNSYENRVYRMDTEDQGPLAAKFYRPGRWSDDAILEEHRFAAQLAEHEIPVVAPSKHHGDTLFEFKGFRFALFPWQPGRSPELNSSDDRALLGRYLGRLHTLGRSEPFQHRPTLDIDSFGYRAVKVLQSSPFIPEHLRIPFNTLTGILLQSIESIFTATKAVNVQRLHGDCHLSNILWTDTGPHIVDLDDCRMGPAIQDIWMLLSGDREDMERQLADILDGYTQFSDLNPAELALIEPLRTLRLLHYNAWLAQRWGDPAFPRNFPWFDSVRYWEEQILSLREQQALLQEPPLRWQK